jgi:uncharacterized surface protein with fasciclin (FAS1) repeats
MMTTTTHPLQIIQSQDCVKTADLSILVQALTKAELAVTLQGTGPFTVLHLPMQHLQLSINSWIRIDK